ncbi:ADP-ribosylation factor GTPase activating protein, ER-Golgi transport [Actinomortierella ambigua]|nr:ADP-ribosylation factor GTPase activating protein, ER-Golgi transport [Actinomortierella ambigua]
MTIAEPTKQESLDFLKRLKAQHANKASVHRNMGVHISFVRSTLLDSWSWDQLRTMKVGGNTAAKEFFSKSPISMASKDAKTKYTSKVAISYKEKLEQRRAEDAAKNPGRLIPDPSAAAAAPTQSVADEDDFFNTWNQPKKPTSATTSSSTNSTRSSTPTSSTLPGIGLGMRAGSPNTTTTSTTTSTTTTSSSTSQAAPSSTTSAPLTSTTSRTALSRPQRSTILKPSGSGSSGGSGLGGGASKPMKLGVKRVGTTSFEAAEARARAEAERIAQLGAEAAEAERMAQKQAAERAAEQERMRQEQGYQQQQQQSSSSQQQKMSYYQANKYQSANGANGQGGEEDGLARLGMGMSRMTFGAVPTGQGSGGGANGSRYSNQPESTAARDKFGSQKAISSDQYFGRNNYDSRAQAEANQRLQAFSGATSISSNQYFGRNEEEVHDMDDRGASVGDQLGNEFAALGDVVKQGANILSNILNDMSSQYNY